MFPYRLRDARVETDAREAGMEPMMSWPYRFSVVKAVSAPKVVGRLFLRVYVQVLDPVL